MARAELEEVADGHGHGNGQAHVARNGRHLAAAQAGDEGHQIFQIAGLGIAAVGAAGLVHTGGDGVGGHGGLLGGHGAVENVDEDEAQAVIEAKAQGLGEGGQVELGQFQLVPGHEGDDKAPQQGGTEQGEVIPAAFRNVVFPGAPRVIRHPAGQQFHILAPVIPQIVLAAFGLDQFLEKGH